MEKLNLDLDELLQKIRVQVKERIQSSSDSNPVELTEFDPLFRRLYKALSPFTNRMAKDIELIKIHYPNVLDKELSMCLQIVQEAKQARSALERLKKDIIHEIRMHRLMNGQVTYGTIDSEKIYDIFPKYHKSLLSKEDCTE